MPTSRATSTEAPLEATLRLYFAKDLSGTPASLPATIRVQTGKKIWKETVMIPAGQAWSEPLPVSVPAGFYTVEVLFPSGVHVTAEGEVAPNEQADVTLHGPESRHEWLSWSSYATDKNFLRPKKPARRRATMPARPRRVLLSAGDLDAPAETRSTIDVLESESQAEATLREVMGPEGRIRFWRRQLGNQWQLSPTQAHVAEKDAQVVVLTVTRHGPLVPDRSPDTHLLAEVAGNRGLSSEFSVVPVRWPDGHGGDARIAIVVDALQADASLPLERNLRMRTTVMDSDFANLSGYLVQGDMRALETVNESMAPRAEALFAGKLEHPLLATAAALALLKARQLDLLHDWTRNLAALFPNLPDGPVIRAWHLLYAGHSKKAAGDYPETPLQHLLDAARRGLPVFSESLRLLVDGLRLFKSRENEEVATSIARMEGYLWASDPGEEFTSFRGIAPHIPGTPGASRPLPRNDWSLHWTNVP